MVLACSGADMRGVDRDQRGALAELGRVHLIGVAGAGMSALTRMLCARGVPVTGSELRESRIVASLRAVGASVHIGQSRDSLPDVDTVIVSTAIGESNPELVAARERGVRVLHRAEALAYCMQGRRSVVVAGTHGKTTTTSMAAVALQHAGLTLRSTSGPSSTRPAPTPTPDRATCSSPSPTRVTAPSWCSNRRSRWSPTSRATTSTTGVIEDAVHAGFRRFADGVPPRGVVIACGDDPGAAAVASYAQDVGRRVVTYGAAASADVRITDVALDATGAWFRPVVKGRRLPDVSLKVLGMHNVLNAAGALSVALEVGVGVGEAVEGLALYTRCPAPVRAQGRGRRRPGVRRLRPSPHRAARDPHRGTPDRRGRGGSWWPSSPCASRGRCGSTGSSVRRWVWPTRCW